MDIRMSTEQKEFDCNGCGLSARSVVLSLGSLPFYYGIKNPQAEARFGGQRYPAQLIACPHCGLVQQLYAPWLDDLLSFTYQSAESSNPSAAAGEGGWGAVVAKGFAGLLSEVSPRRVLEIGCGSGALLDDCKKRGAQLAVGFEPSAQPCVTPHGAHIERSMFSPELARRHAPSFDLIYSFAVLEHVREVRHHLTSVASLLEPGGHLMLEMPNGYASLLDGDLGLFIHEHLSHFTPASLRWMLTSAGMEIRTLYHNRSEIIVHAVKAANAADLPRLTPDTGAANLSAYAERLRANVSAASALSTGVGRGTVFYGACATLCNLAALSPRDDQVSVLDSDPAKWGRQISGVDVDIKSPDNFDFSENLDVVVVPYAFQEAILADLTQRGIQSTLVPLYKGIRYVPTSAQ